MSKTSILFISLLLLLLSNPNKSSAQQCLENLRKARNVYDEGRLHEIFDVLGEDCLGEKSDLNEEKKSEAYRLLILSHIYQDQPQLADQAMLDLLHENPRFKINEDTDPNELINLYKTFRTDPIFRWGVKLTGKYSIVNIMKTFSVNSGFDANGKYSSDISFGGTFFIERDFVRKRIALRTEFTYSAYKMTYTGTAFSQDKSPGVNTASYLDVESQSWVRLGILGRYGFFKNLRIGKQEIGQKINPTLIFGPSVQYLLSSRSSNSTGIEGGESARGADIDFLKAGIRKKIDFSAIVGVGMTLHSGKLSILFEMTYQYGLVNITNKNTSPELSFKYGRAMSDLNLNSLNLSVGLMFNKYSPKKLIY